MAHDIRREFMLVSAASIRMRSWDGIGAGRTAVPLQFGTALRRYRHGHLSASALGPLIRFSVEGSAMSYWH